MAGQRAAADGKAGLGQISSAAYCSVSKLLIPG
jgi:hypothetical protein